MASDALAWTTFGSAPVSTSQAHSRVSSRAAEASAAESASGKRHALEVVDPLAELDALGGPLDGERQQALHRAAAARPDVDPLLDEPLVGQLVGLPDAAEDRPTPGRGRPSRTNCGCRSANVCM